MTKNMAFHSALVLIESGRLESKRPELSAADCRRVRSAVRRAVEAAAEELAHHAADMMCRFPARP